LGGTGKDSRKSPCERELPQQFGGHGRIIVDPPRMGVWFARIRPCRLSRSGIQVKKMMTPPVISTGMAEIPFCIALDPDLEEPVRQLSEKRGCGCPDDLVNSALRMYVDTLQGPGTKGQDLAFEIEILRRQVEELKQRIRRKDEEISVLLRLWEQCPLDKREREVPPEIEEKISRLLQNWYFNSERKDFS
jgi:hypothetical protein